MNVNKVLLAAADIIEKDGWCQHVYANNTGAHCLVGAIYDAARFDTLSVIAAKEKVMKCVGHKLLNWNDAPERTESEVVNALREAARL